MLPMIVISFVNGTPYITYCQIFIEFKLCTVLHILWIKQSCA